jgi:hypothetical protein
MLRAAAGGRLSFLCLGAEVTWAAEKDKIQSCAESNQQEKESELHGVLRSVGMLAMIGCVPTLMHLSSGDLINNSA